ncbi:MAG: class I SAM-dependent methyltransferase [Spirochaetales bacterium]|nr:class I SAM-dependent methyltransferase [Spirochaetales bacterium]
MFGELNTINARPGPFEYYTAKELWTGCYISRRMLEHHLDGSVDISSRNISFIERSVEWIVSHFGLEAGSKVADFGCGPGLYTTRLAEKGMAVTGIDFSERSLRYARQTAKRKSLDITYINENYLDLRLDETFDLIIMIFCDYCALSPQQRKRLSAVFHTSLEPDGRLLLDVCSFAAFEKKHEAASYSYHPSNGFWTPHPYYEFLNTFTYEREKVTVDKYTIVEERRTSTIYNWLQYFSRNTLEEEFGNAGFCIHDYFADVAGSAFSPDADEFAVAAGKRMPLSGKKE